MKSHWFSVLSVAGIILFAGSVSGSELRWKKAENSEVVESSVLQIPTVISTDDEMPAPTGPVISQVQYTEPVQPPRVIQPSAAQLDQTYPELRPQSVPVPSGATLRPVPLPPSNTPILIETPTRTAPTQTQSTERSQTGTPTRTNAPARTTEQPLTVCDDKITLRSIREISHDIRPTQPGELPPECIIDGAPYYGRHFSQSCVQWKASGVCTKAAYFEDVQLERYGHTVVGPVLQPVVSGAKFFATIPILPYKMGVTPPNECVYTLGHHRVGSRSPYMVEPFPISARGALFQAGAVAGAVAAIP